MRRLTGIVVVSTAAVLGVGTAVAAARISAPVTAGPSTTTTTRPSDVPRTAVAPSPPPDTPTSPTSASSSTTSSTGRPTAVTAADLLGTADLAVLGVGTGAQRSVTRVVAEEPGGGTTAASVAPIAVCQESQLASLPGALGPALQATFTIGDQQLVAEVAGSTSSRTAADDGYAELVSEIAACRRHVTRGSEHVSVGPSTLVTTVGIDGSDARAVWVKLLDGDTGLKSYYGAVTQGTRLAVVAYYGSTSDPAVTLPALLAKTVEHLTPG